MSKSRIRKQYQLTVARLRPEFHALVKQCASPKVGYFTGIDSMIQTALLLLVEDIARDKEFQRAYQDIYGEKLVPPGDGTITD